MLGKPPKKQKVKGFSLGGSVMPENTERPGQLFADQMTTYGVHNLLKSNKKHVRKG